MFFKKNNIAKSMKKFNKFYNKKGLKYSKETEDLYDEIKEKYKTMISKKEINLKTEKIRLEKNIGKYYSVNENIYITGCISIIVSLFVTIYLKEFIEELAEKFPLKYKFSIYCISTIAIIILVVIAFIFLTNKSLEKRNLYNICLKVIEDIEKKNEKKEKLKERLENIKILLENIYKPCNEVAITKDNKLECIINNTEEIKKFIGIK